MSRLEGNGASRFVQLMRNNSYNPGLRIEVAVVKNTSPITFGFHNEDIEFDDDSYTIADHLIEHTRTVSINGGPDVEMIVRSPLKVGDQVIVISTESGQLIYVLDKAII